MKLSLLVLLTLFSLNCFSAGLVNASAHYKEKRDYYSLEILTNSIQKGMSRDAVEKLVGEEDYSPIQNIAYYSSDTDVSLVISYTNEESTAVEVVESFVLDVIDE